MIWRWSRCFQRFLKHAQTLPRCDKAAAKHCTKLPLMRTCPTLCNAESVTIPSQPLEKVSHAQISVWKLSRVANQGSRPTFQTLLQSNRCMQFVYCHSFMFVDLRAGPCTPSSELTHRAYHYMTVNLHNGSIPCRQGRVNPAKWKWRCKGGDSNENRNI